MKEWLKRLFCDHSWRYVDNSTRFGIVKCDKCGKEDKVVA